MKHNTQAYFRAFYLTLIILFCLCIGWIGISTAYENTVQIALGQYKKAIEITDDSIRILDFEIK